MKTMLPVLKACCLAICISSLLFAPSNISAASKGSLEPQPVIAAPKVPAPPPPSEPQTVQKPAVQPAPTIKAPAQKPTAVPVKVKPSVKPPTKPVSKQPVLKPTASPEPVVKPQPRRQVTPTPKPPAQPSGKSTVKPPPQPQSGALGPGPSARPEKQPVHGATMNRTPEIPTAPIVRQGPGGTGDIPESVEVPKSLSEQPQIKRPDEHSQKVKGIYGTVIIIPPPRPGEEAPVQQVELDERPDQASMPSRDDLLKRRSLPLGTPDMDDLGDYPPPPRSEPKPMTSGMKMTDQIKTMSPGPVSADSSAKVDEAPDDTGIPKSSKPPQAGYSGKPHLMPSGKIIIAPSLLDSATSGKNASDSIMTGRPHPLSITEGEVQMNKEVERLKRLKERLIDELGQATPLPEGVDSQKIPRRGDPAEIPGGLSDAERRRLQGSGSYQSDEQIITGHGSFQNSDGDVIQRTTDEHGTRDDNINTGGFTDHATGESATSTTHTFEDDTTITTTVGSNGDVTYVYTDTDGNETTLTVSASGEAEIHQRNIHEEQPENPEDDREATGEGQDDPENELLAQIELLQLINKKLSSMQDARSGQAANPTLSTSDSESEPDTSLGRGLGPGTALVPRDDDPPNEAQAASINTNVDQGLLPQSEALQPAIPGEPGDDGPVGPKASHGQTMMPATDSTASPAEPGGEVPGDDPRTTDGPGDDTGIPKSSKPPQVNQPIGTHLSAPRKIVIAPSLSDTPTSGAKLEVQTMTPGPISQQGGLINDKPLVQDERDMPREIFEELGRQMELDERIDQSKIPGEEARNVAGIIEGILMDAGLTGVPHPPPPPGGTPSPGGTTPIGGDDNSVTSGGDTDVDMWVSSDGRIIQETETEDGRRIRWQSNPDGTTKIRVTNSEGLSLAVVVIHANGKIETSDGSNIVEYGPKEPQDPDTVAEFSELEDEKEQAGGGDDGGPGDDGGLQAEQELRAQLESQAAMQNAHNARATDGSSNTFDFRPSDDDGEVPRAPRERTPQVPINTDEDRPDEMQVLSGNTNIDQSLLPQSETFQPTIGDDGGPGPVVPNPAAGELESQASMAASGSVAQPSIDDDGGEPMPPNPAADEAIEN